MFSLTQEIPVRNHFKYDQNEVEFIKKEFYNNERSEFTDIINCPSQSFLDYKKIDKKVQVLSNKLEKLETSAGKTTKNENKLEKFKRLAAKVGAVFLAIIGSLSIVGIPVMAYLEREDGPKFLQHMWMGSKAFYNKEVKRLDGFKEEKQFKFGKINACLDEIKTLNDRIMQRLKSEMENEVSLNKRIKSTDDFEEQAELHAQLSICANKISQLLYARNYIVKADQDFRGQFLEEQITPK